MAPLTLTRLSFLVVKLNLDRPELLEYRDLNEATIGSG